MGVIWTSRTRNRQPWGAVGPSSLKQNLKGLWTPTRGLVNAVDGLAASTVYANPTNITNKKGRAWYSGSGDFDNGWNAPLKQAVKNCTYLAWMRPDSAPTTATQATPLFHPYAGLQYSHGLTGYQLAMFIDNGGSYPKANFTDKGAGVDVLWVGTYDGVNVSAYTDGVLSQSTAATGNLTTSTTDLYLGTRGYGSQFVGAIYLLAFWDRALSAAEVTALARNPWQLFAPERRPKFFSVGSGANTYAATISETATASETAAAVASFLSNISETVTANETMIASAVFGSAISETVTASQTNASVVTFTTAVSETSTASDTIAAAIGAGTFAATISETATASETVSATAAFVASISETATASDSISSLVSFISAVSETATASDTIAAQLANQTYAATVLESVTASDTIVGTVPTVYAAAVIETISISDIAGATVTNPSTFWTQIGTTQSAGWGQINNTQSSGWTIIPTT